MVSHGEWIECTAPTVGPYLAFVPSPIAVDWVSPSHLWAHVERAAQRLGSLNDLLMRVPNPHLLMLYPTVREAHASAKVEGTTTTLAQALGFENPPADPVASGDFARIQDHLAAQELAVARARRGSPGLEDLLAVHAILVRSHEDQARAEPGRWRSTQVIVPGERPGILHARHVPPPPEAVVGCMAELEQFFTRDHGLPTLVATALAHAQFELIHPFGDGNGRMGRILILMLLLHRGALREPVLFLSDYFRVHRSEYFDRLGDVAARAAWTEWTEFFLRGVIEVAEAAMEVAQDVVRLRERLLSELTAASRSMAAQRLLDQLFVQPRTTVAQAARATDVPAPTLYPVFHEFGERGWLRVAARGEQGREYAFEPLWEVVRDSGRLRS